MKTKSKRSPVYKALFWDYNAILNASEAECSYCLTQREIQLLLPIVDYIGWQTRYIHDVGNLPDQELLHQWQGELARKLMAGCCNDFPYTRYTDEGIYEVSEDGENWVERRDLDPRFNAPYLPPLPGDPGDDLRCEAASNVTGFFRSVADDLIADAGIWAGLSGILAALGALLIVLLSLATGGATVLLLALAAALLQTGQAAFDAAMTEAVYDIFQCIVFCRTPDNGEYSEADWQGIKADILAQLTGVAATFLHDQVNFVGLVGLTNASRSGLGDAEGDCDDCDCPAGCADKYTPLTVNHGTIVGSGAGYIDVAAGNPGTGTGYIILRSTTIGDCCWLDSIEPRDGGTLLANFLQNCGTPYSEGAWINATPVGGCRQAIQIQTQVGKVWRFYMSDCP